MGVVDRGTAIALTLAVGAGFAMQAPINSALGRDIGPIPAATVSFAAGTIALFVVAVAFGGGFGRIGAHPVWWHYVAGGLIGAAVVEAQSSGWRSARPSASRRGAGRPGVRKLATVATPR